MSYYPDTKDKDFFERVYHKKEFYQNRKKYIDDPKEFEAQCDRTAEEFELQTQQRLVRNYINPHTPYRNLLVMWGTGVGKTLGAISIAENFREYIRKIREKTTSRPFIYVVSSHEARNNFIKELFSKFVSPEYITDAERRKLVKLGKQTDTKAGSLQYDAYKRELETRLTDPAKGGYYKFMGYGVFQNRTLGAKFRTDTKKLVKTEKGDYKRKRSMKTIENMDNSVLIIDEAHRIEGIDWGRSVELMIARSKNLRVILLTATPMINLPDEIVQMLNFLLPIDQKIKKKEVFEPDNFTLKPGALNVIGKKSQGYVSYLRGVNPYTFPKRIEMGVVLKQFGFKYTHLVPCPMSPLHLRTYQQQFAEKKPTFISEDRGLLDMVLPNPEDKNIGIFRTSDINTILARADTDFLQKHGIELARDPRDTKNIIITGSILKENNLKTYSDKFYRVLKNILKSLVPDNGPVLVYDELIVGIGLLLFEQVLLRNGFDLYDLSQSVEYNQNNAAPGTLCVLCGRLKKDHKQSERSGCPRWYPAKLIVLYGKIEHNQRNKIVGLLNDFQNKNGIIIKAVLGSKITGESIDLKRIREVHILNFQPNIPSILQIEGRAVRHCSHVGLPQNQRNVKIFKYVSSIPGEKEPSIEEKIYLRAEKKHIVIKKIERVLKENAIDCALNKFENIIEEEMRHYKDCETKKNPGKLCSALCDYQDCNYKCVWEPSSVGTGKDLKKFKELFVKDLDTSTYKLYFYKEEINKIKKSIAKLFGIDIIWSYDDIKREIKNMGIDLLEERYIHLALDEMVREKSIVLNEFGYPGYILYRGHWYIFQPSDSPDDGLPLLERLVPVELPDTREVSIRSYLEARRVKTEEERMTKEDITDKIIAAVDVAKVGRILGKLSMKMQQRLLEDAILSETVSRTTKTKLESGQAEYNKKVLEFYKDYLVTNKQLEDSGFASSDTFSTESVQIDDLIVGHLLGKRPRCLTDTGWENCVKDFTKRRKIAKENNIIIGFIDKDRTNKLVFKLRPPIDPRQFIDRRKIPRGFVCSQSSNKKLIQKIVEKLGLQKERGSIQVLCDKIEVELRRREIKNKGKSKWFYEYLEVQDMVS